MHSLRGTAAASLVMLLFLTSTAPAALKPAPSVADVERALAIARGSDAERARFHARYVFSPDDPVVERLEILTELRRIVLTGEARHDNWLFLHSPTAAQEAVQSWRGLVTIVAQLRFHPQNVLVSVPPYSVAVSRSAEGGDLVPSGVRTAPTWSLPFRTPQGEATALLGAVVEADFRALDLPEAARVVRVMLDEKPVVSLPVDFSRID